MSDHQLILSAELNLDELLSGDDWGTTVGEIVKEEIERAVRSALRTALKNNPDFDSALRRLVQKGLEEIKTGKWPK